MNWFTAFIFLISIGCTKKQDIHYKKTESGFLVSGGYAVKISAATPRLANGDYLIGDIMFPKSSFFPSEEKAFSLSAIGGSVEYFRYAWKDSIIPYVIDSSVLDPAAITAGITFLNDTTAMTLVPRTDEADYVVIKETEEGCGRSFLGRIGGPQDLHFKSTCSNGIGSFYHEMLHAFGFSHTQNREDRDTYVTILTENILEGAEGAFETFTQEGFDAKTFGPYDFSSIMHYSAFAFSSNDLPTIVAKNNNVINFQRDDLTPTDRMIIQNLVDHEKLTQTRLIDIDEDVTRMSGGATVVNDDVYKVWLEHFENGGTREQMQIDLANEPIVTSTINANFQGIFNRPPTETELNEQRQILINGADLAELRALLAASDQTKVAVEESYKRIMDKEIATEQLNNVMTSFATTGSLLSFENQLIQSTEFLKKLVLTSREVFLKDPIQSNVTVWQSYVESGNSLIELRQNLESGTPIN